MVLNNDGIAYTNASAYGFYFDGDSVGLTALFPDVFGAPQNGKPAPFCTQCDFFKWGATGAAVQFSNGDGPDDPSYVDVVSLGWWIAGDIPQVGQLPTTGSATYAGNTIGTILTRVNNYSSNYNPAWQSYIGAGKAGLTRIFRIDPANSTSATSRRRAAVSRL